MKKSYAIVLLRMWGSVQSGEISKQYYPSVSPMFRDYQAGYRSSSYWSPEREELINRVGYAVNALHPALRSCIKGEFLLGGEKKAPSRTRAMALNQFIREFESIAEAGSGLPAGD